MYRILLIATLESDKVERINYLKMLTVKKLTDRTEKLADYHTNIDNYYFSKENFEDGWKTNKSKLSYVRIYGRLCDDLHLLKGMQICRDDFNNLLKGYDVDGNKKRKKCKVHGIDLTFNAPKSVSTAALVSQKDPAIIKAHEKAVLNTMEEIEGRRSVCRYRKNGKIVFEKTGNMIYAVVKDGVNRNIEPHLHSHVIVFSMTKNDHRDKISALWTRELLPSNYNFNHLWGAVYRSHLANNLHKAGYNISYCNEGFIRLDCVSRELEKAFSDRGTEIDNKMEKGMSHRAAWDSTRKKSKPDIRREQYINKWKGIYKDIGNHPEKRNRELTLSEREEYVSKGKWAIEAQQERQYNRYNTSELRKWQLALERALCKSALVRKETIITEYIYELMRTEKWDDVCYKELTERFSRQVELGNIIQMEDRYTSWNMISAERDYMESADKEVSDWYSFNEKFILKQLDKFQREQRKKKRKTLSEVQYETCKNMLLSEKAVCCVQGYAGSGKTTSLEAIVKILKDCGHKVHGIAVQGITAKNLHNETGLKSTTVASYLSSRRLDTTRNRILILDEASMLGSLSTAVLFKTIQSYDDKIILVGDRNQLESIEAGCPFEKFIELAEKNGELISLYENYRQRTPDLRKAVDFAKKGNMYKSLNVLDKNNHLYEVENLHKNRSEVIAPQYDKSTLIITGTNAGRTELNHAIRKLLLKRGDLSSKDTRKYRLAKDDKQGIKKEIDAELTNGEKITFTKNDYRIDVRNGERATVTKVSRNSIDVIFEDGRKKRIKMEEYNFIDYGYAMTTYKSQGQTFNKVIIDIDTKYVELCDARNTYVNITRARDDITIYTDDKERLKELAEYKSMKRDTLGVDYTKAETDTALIRLRRDENVKHTRSLVKEKTKERKKGFWRTY